MIAFEELTLDLHTGPPGQLSEAKVYRRFDAPITEALAVLRSWELGFHDEDHHLRQARVEVKAQVDPVDPQGVEVVAAIGLEDDGHAPGCRGRVEVLLIAHGETPGEVLQAVDIPLDASRGEMETASRRQDLRFDFEPQQFEAALSGWRLGFAEQDHHVHDMAAGVEALPSPEGPDYLRIKGQVALGDEAHDDRFEGAVGAAVIGLPARSGLLIRSLGTIELSSDPKLPRPLPGEAIIDLGQPLAEAHVFLKGWHIELDEAKDHHLKHARVKLSSYLDPKQPQTVQVGAWLELGDASGELACRGSVDVAVIGRPAAIVETA